LKHNFKLLAAITVCVSAIASNAIAFEGKITVEIKQGNEITPLLYTVGENFLRIEVTGSDRPNPIDIVDLKSGALTLVFPHNRSFVRLTPGSTGNLPVASGSLPGATAAKSSLQSSPNPFGPANAGNGAGESPARPNPPMPQMPTSTGAGMPQMPPMAMPPSHGYGAPGMPPPMMSEKIELKPTGKKEKILGFACEQFKIKQRGETMEIWATDQLIPYQPYLRNRTSRFGPRMIEEQWPVLLTSKKLFPLRVSLHFDNGPSSPAVRRDESVSPRRPDRTGGPERFRFEVKSITPEKIADKDGKLFQPPEGYTEIQPLPF
jgi:hypothetical protein